MALSEQEEFELLSLEREKAMAGAPAQPAAPKSTQQPIKPYSDYGAGAARIAQDAGGKVVDYLSEKLGPGSPIAAGAGTLTKMVLGEGPQMLMGANLGGVAAPVLEKGAKTLMQSSIKPNLAARNSGQSDRAIETMLEKNIPATAGGLEATKTKVGALENDIQSILQNSQGYVDKYKVGQAVTQALGDVKLNLNTVADTKAVNQAYQDFISHPAISPYSRDIHVSDANKLKQAFYNELSGKAYLPGQSISAYDKGEKALARGLRSEVLAAEPKIAPSLAEQSELLNVIKVAGPQIGREGNKNIVGLGWLSPSMERTAAWMLDRYPWFKSYLARTLYTGSERIPAYLGAGAAGIDGELRKEIPAPEQPKKKEERPTRTSALNGVRG